MVFLSAGGIEKTAPWLNFFSSMFYEVTLSIERGKISKKDRALQKNSLDFFYGNSYLSGMRLTRGCCTMLFGGGMISKLALLGPAKQG